MKPKETANQIIDILKDADKVPLEDRYSVAKMQLLSLCSILIASEPSFGHAERIHKLTGGNDNGSR